MHAENLKRLQDWIALPSIAAENRNYPQGPEHMAKLAQDAGFTGVKLIPTSGKAGLGVDPQLWPRSAGSWPGYVFTDAPLKLPAGHFGLGHGTGAHAPDEYYVIESSNPKVQGLDGAIASFVEYLFAMA